MAFEVGDRVRLIAQPAQRGTVELNTPDADGDIVVVNDGGEYKLLDPALLEYEGESFRVRQLTLYEYSNSTAPGKRPIWASSDLSAVLQTTGRKIIVNEDGTWTGVRSDA